MYNQQIFRIGIQKILNRKVCCNHSILLGITIYLRICNKPLGIHTPNFIGKFIHCVASILNADWKQPVRINRCNAVPHVNCIHFIYIPVEFIDFLLFIIKLDSRQRCLLQFCCHIRICFICQKTKHYG